MSMEVGPSVCIPLPSVIHQNFTPCAASPYTDADTLRVQRGSSLCAALDICVAALTPAPWHREGAGL